MSDIFELMRYTFPALAALAAACVAAVQPVVPELFGEGVISTPDYELNAAFLPDGKTVYFTKSTANMGFWTIVSSRLVNGRWTEPEVAPFSGTFSDADLAVTPDGTRLVFISRRPVPGNPGRPVPHIWYVDRTAAGWTEPRNAAALNSEAGEYYPSAAADGTLYFESARAGGKGRADVYRSRLLNGGYSAPENLEAPLNSEFNEGDVAIAPDHQRPSRRNGYGRFIYFRAKGRRVEQPASSAPGHQFSGTRVLPESLPGWQVSLLHKYKGIRGGALGDPGAAAQLPGTDCAIERGSERARQYLPGAVGGGAAGRPGVDRTYRTLTKRQELRPRTSFCILLV
jgi:hypothetical protein